MAKGLIMAKGVRTRVYRAEGARTSRLNGWCKDCQRPVTSQCQHVKMSGRERRRMADREAQKGTPQIGHEGPMHE